MNQGSYFTDNYKSTTYRSSDRFYQLLSNANYLYSFPDPTKGFDSILDKCYAVENVNGEYEEDEDGEVTYTEYYYLPVLSPFALLPETLDIQKREERDNLQYYCTLLTREEYFQYVNPQFFDLELYNNLKFWEHPFVLHTEHCLHSAAFCNFLLAHENYGTEYTRILSENDYSVDFLLHYNPISDPMNSLDFHSFYFPQMVSKLFDDTNSISINLNLKEYSVFCN